MALESLTWKALAKVAPLGVARIDELAQLVGLPAPLIALALGGLLGKGLVRRTAANTFVAVKPAGPGAGTT